MQFAIPRNGRRTLRYNVEKTGYGRNIFRPRSSDSSRDPRRSLPGPWSRSSGSWPRPERPSFFFLFAVCQPGVLGGKAMATLPCKRGGQIIFCIIERLVLLWAPMVTSKHHQYICGQRGQQMCLSLANGTSRLSAAHFCCMWEINNQPSKQYINTIQA